MYYEEKLIDGVWYWRSTPDDEWSVKKLQMAKKDEPKWPSPNGHAIASDVTDKQLTKTPENVSCENLTNADVIQDAITYGTGFMKDGKHIDQKDVYLSPEAQLLSEAVKVIEDLQGLLRAKFDDPSRLNDCGAYIRARDFLAKVR